MEDKIAVMVDSACDIPPALAKERGVYIVPLKINYPDQEYRDGLDITPREVYEKLQESIPSTSLPSGEEILTQMEQIRADGFTQVICVNISTGLSGTHNMVKIVADEIEDMEIRLIDSKNIAMGSGFLGIYAQDLVDAGLSLDEVAQRVAQKVTESQVFFCVDTLKYLQKGGRIGLVSSILGTTLNLKPIICCNDDGIYHTVGKVRGKRQAVQKMNELVQKRIAGRERYAICVSNGGAYDEFDQFRAEVQGAFPNVTKFYETEISPTLGVHTGPGLLGLGVFILD